MSLKPLIGHQKELENLANLAIKNVFPHALLITGAKGIGKRLLAETIGQFLLCGGTVETGKIKINQTSSFIPQIEADACPDWNILEVGEKSKIIKIDQVRELINKLALASDNKRIVIIDSADEMGIEASNALLKILEEPRPNIHFILLSHNHFKLLPTIISRCRKENLQPLSLQETEQVITANADFDFETVQKMAQNSNGSPGQALQFGEIGIAISQQLEEVLNGKTNPTQVADKLASKKHAPIALDILMQKLARSVKNNPSQKNAIAYKHIQNLQNKMATHNLSANWALEETLRKL